MKNDLCSLPLSDLGFVKIIAALKSEYKHDPIICKSDLEKKIYKLHGDPAYSKVFDDIIFICPEDEEPRAELYYGFQMANAFGMISKLNDDEDDDRYISNFDIDSANDALSIYYDDILVPMINLYNEVYSKQRKRTK